MKFSIKDFFSKYDQIRRKLWIWSHLPKKFLMVNVIFCTLLIQHVVLAVFNMSQWNTMNETSKSNLFSLFKMEKQTHRIRAVLAWFIFIFLSYYYDNKVLLKFGQLNLQITKCFCLTRMK